METNVSHGLKGMMSFLTYSPVIQVINESDSIDNFKLRFVIMG